MVKEISANYLHTYWKSNETSHVYTRYSSRASLTVILSEGDTGEFAPFGKREWLVGFRSHEVMGEYITAKN